MPSTFYCIKIKYVKSCKSPRKSVPRVVMDNELLSGIKSKKSGFYLKYMRKHGGFVGVTDAITPSIFLSNAVTKKERFGLSILKYGSNYYASFIKIA